MTTTRPDLDTAAAVLAFARERRADAERAEVDVLHAAVTWAEQHPAESIDVAATWVSGGGDTGLPLAGPGAPLVAEFAIAEFALAIGRSTDSGRVYLADAVELKYRLPRHWARVQAGTLQVWRARRIAQATLGLTMEAAGFVDAQVAAFAHKIGPAQLDRLIADAVHRFMPARAEADAQAAAERRHVTFHHHQVSFAGTTFVEAELDLADALDLDTAIAQGAANLAEAGCLEPLDVRRAMAAGELARRQLALDLASAADTETDTEAETTHRTPRGNRTKPRQMVLYVHLSEAAITGPSDCTGGGTGLARVENHRRGVTTDQVRTWCANPDTQVTVKPVIDLAEHIHVEAYEVPERLQEQTELRDHTCVFPWCTRPARRTDSEHCIPHDQGGTTCSCNIAPLCRRHHRLKTHSAWRYTTLEPGTFVWNSPHGYQYLRDHTGTLDVSPERPPPRAEPPHLC